LSERSVHQVFSWTVIPNQKIVKRIDRSVILYKMTGIPVEIRWFFELNQLDPGDKIEILLHYEARSYEATLSMSMQESPRTRMTWGTNFENEIQKKFATQHRWKVSNEELEKTGYIIFEKKSPVFYEVSLQDQIF